MFPFLTYFEIYFDVLNNILIELSSYYQFYYTYINFGNLAQALLHTHVNHHVGVFYRHPLSESQMCF